MNKYIFLDFNGTVLDDIELCINLLNEMLSEKEGKTVTVEEYKKIFCFPIINYTTFN
jgi:phosphoglycolate phosphatase